MPASEIQVTIGDITFNGTFTPGSSCYLLMSTEDILGALTTRRSDTQKQGAHGVEPSLSHYEPRELLFRGEIHAETQAQRVSMQQALDEELALARLQSYAGDDGFKLVEITDEDGVAKQLYAVVVQMPRYELIDTALPESRKFDFILMAPEPEVYSQTLVTEDSMESYNTTTFTIQDLDLPTFKDGELPTFQDVQGNVLEVENEGNYPTPVLLTITGPTENPVIRNVTANKSISFTRDGGVTLAAGETLEIDTGAYTAVKSSGGVETNVRSKVSLDSEWFDLAPGVNEISLFDDTIDEEAGGMEVQYRHAWI